MPTAPPYFLIVFLLALFIQARPCFYCASLRFFLYNLLTPPRHRLTCRPLLQLLLLAAISPHQPTFQAMESGRHYLLRCAQPVNPGRVPDAAPTRRSHTRPLLV
uniref:Secreted protein n=1 Tax=Mycena chlorophos TaxID=658473 RepID=A0ABQ0M2P2_MYCCL|nr:predicted protein [Mycena chlorophos]